MTPAPKEQRSIDAGAADGAKLSPLRHWGGFLFSGGLAFIVDWGVLELGVRIFGLPPLISRLLSITCAMLAAWLSHRTLTFAITLPPTFAELARYVAAASTTAILNYALFAGTMFIWPEVSRFSALFAASIVATIFSYLSMRYGVFRRSAPDLRAE